MSKKASHPIITLQSCPEIANGVIHSSCSQVERTKWISPSFTEWSFGTSVFQKWFSAFRNCWQWRARWRAGHGSSHRLQTLLTSFSTFCFLMLQERCSSGLLFPFICTFYIDLNFSCVSDRFGCQHDATLCCKHTVLPKGHMTNAHLFGRRGEDEGRWGIFVCLWPFC